MTDRIPSLLRLLPIAGRRLPQHDLRKWSPESNTKLPNRRLRRWEPAAGNPPLVLPAILFVGALVACHCLGIDLYLASLFHRPQDGRPWPLDQTAPWILLYRYGPWPALAMAAAGLIVGLVALWRGGWNASRGWIFLVAVMLLGPGLVINSGFKLTWGRARPHQIEQFGGDRQYTAPWDADFSGPPNSSFPSGHAAMGFYLMAPGVLLYRRRPRLARWLIATGVLAGIAIGVARIVSGGHFASDVCGSAAVVYLVSVALYYALRFHAEPWEAELFPRLTLWRGRSAS